ncbi:MAG: membrane protein of unknown function [Promethearchaeota archaeon]|nr:MAG: membrane protein of unknown function [Candidatus Lokiarchaeota archaeon]
MISNVLVLSISFTLLLLTSIIYHKSRRYHTDIKFLMISLLSITIANTSVGVNINNIFFTPLFSSFLSLGILFLFFHYESISHPRPRLTVLIVLIGLFIFLLSLKFMLPLYMNLKGISLEGSYQDLRSNDDIFIYTIFRMSNFTQSVIICTVFLLAFYNVIKELRLFKSKEILIEAIGLLLLNIYGFLYLIRDLFLYETYYEFLTSLALIFSLIGLVLIISNFIIHPDYLYLLPFPIFSFMIFNEGGSLCYVRKVKKLDSDTRQQDLEHLMAGAFTAVSNMFKEVLGTGANIRYIDADTFKILVTALPKKKGVLVVISRGETALFKNSIKRFTRTWSPQLLKEVNEIVDLNELRPKIDVLIKSSFPYVVFS